jgi:hypothetical protein
VLIVFRPYENYHGLTGLTFKRGSYRHTSSQDKTDSKKVVTTSFYKSKNDKIATCHAHCDGTWNVLFTARGKTELQTLGASSTVNEGRQLEVNVRSVEKFGQLFHYGEIIDKPQACRGYVSINEDDVHRMNQSDPATEIGNIPIPAGSSTANHPGANYLRGRTGDTMIHNKQPRSRKSAVVPPVEDYQVRTRLTDEQKQLASDLAKEAITRKEERDLFQKLKSLSWEEQEHVLKLSKAKKAETIS